MNANGHRLDKQEFDGEDIMYYHASSTKDLSTLEPHCEYTLSTE